MRFQDIINMPLVKVQQLYQCGYVSDAQWSAYAHMWQTASPRFSVRICDCKNCRVSHGHLQLDQQMRARELSS